MADRFKNVWVVDAASANPVTDELTCIQSIRWVGGQAGDEVEIADIDGNVLWASIAEVNDFVDNDNSIDIRLEDGFIVPTLDSGVLYIYIRARV